MADPYEGYLDRSVVTQAPKFNLSSDDIAQPARTLAHSLDKAGEALTDVSVPLAEEAGTRAGANVRTDDAGNLVYDRAPIVGPAGTAYARAARMTALAKITPDVDNKLLELRLQYPNDPAGYQAAASSFVDTLTKSIPDEHLSAAVGKQAGEAAAHNYRTSLVETNSNQVSEALQSYQARLKDINERSGSLARQGGTETPEYQSLAHDRAQFYQELTGDPRFKFSKDRADLELKENRDQDVVQSVIGDAQRLFQTKKNAAEATQYLQDKFWGPGSENLNLTAQKRDHGVAEGLHALANLTAQDREAVAENRQAVTGYIATMRTDPSTFDDFRHNDMVERAKTVGDYKSLADLQSAKTFLPMWSDLKKMNPEQATKALSDMSRGIVPGGPIDASIQSEAKRVGLDPNVLRRYVAIESGGNPAAQTGSYKGLLQLSDAEFKQYGAGGNIMDPGANLAAGANALKARADLFEKQNGRPPTATELYLAHQQGAGGLAAHMGNPNAPAWQNMLSTAEGQAKGATWAKAAVWGNVPADVRSQFPGGVDTMTSRDFMNVWQRKVEGQLTPGSRVDISADSASSRLFQSTIHDLRATVAKNADDAFTGISTAVQKGDALAPGELDNFVTMAVQSGRDDLIAKIKPTLAAADMKAGLPEGTSATAVEAQAAQLKASGVSNVERQALTHLSDMVATDAKALKEQPLLEGARKGWFGAVGPLDAANPDAFAGEIADRNKKAAVVEQHDPGHGPIAVIAKDEGEKIATQLTNGDPANAGKLLGSIGQLSPDNYKATMISQPIKNAVIGMSGSSDPNRMAAGMTTMDRLWRQDPGAFKAAYGETAMNRLQAWQVLKDQFSSQEISDRINKAEDPSMIEAISKLKEAAEKEIKTDPQGVANQMGSWLQRNVWGFNAEIPADNRQAQQMAVQFTDTYKTMRTMGLDPSQAKEAAGKRLGETWGQSSVAGGQLMMHAPERTVNPQNGRLYYPPIDGSQSWMTDQLSADLEKLIGPQVTVTNEGLPDAVAIGNWRIAGLSPDQKTQAEISSGKPPRYQVAVQRNGATELVMGADGKPLRYRWDADAAKAAALPGMMARDQRAREIRNNVENMPTGPM